MEPNRDPPTSTLSFVGAIPAGITAAADGVDKHATHGATAGVTADK